MSSHFRASGRKYVGDLCKIWQMLLIMWVEIQFQLTPEYQAFLSLEWEMGEKLK